MPPGSHAIVCIPGEYKSVDVNGVQIFDRKAIRNDLASFEKVEDGYIYFKIGSGEYSFSAS